MTYNSDLKSRSIIESLTGLKSLVILIRPCDGPSSGLQLVDTLSQISTLSPKFNQISITLWSLSTTHKIHDDSSYQLIDQIWLTQISQTQLFTQDCLLTTRGTFYGPQEGSVDSVSKTFLQPFPFQVLSCYKDHQHLTNSKGWPRIKM